VQSATAHFIYKVKSIKEDRDILYYTKKSKVACRHYTKQNVQNLQSDSVFLIVK